jgi:hypothetical protein
MPTQPAELIASTTEQLLSSLPRILAAVTILVVGYIVGRVLGGVVARLLRRFGIRQHGEGGNGDGLATAIGNVVAYYSYFVALLASSLVLGVEELTGALTELSGYLPIALSALAVLVVGFVVGRLLGDRVANLVGESGVGRYLRETPVADVGDEQSVGYLVGKLVTYYVYLLTLLAVADILDIAALTSVLERFVGYLPALAAGLLVLLAGIWLAERAGEVVADTGDGRPTHIAGIGVKVLVYYLTVTVALSTTGVDTTIFTELFSAFTVALFGALGLATAIGVGLALGLGGKDFVAENIDDWAAPLVDAVDPGDEDSSSGFNYE